MSIVRRLVNLGRSELNSLLDHVADIERDKDLDEHDPWAGLDALSDDELVAELERRKRARDREAAGAKAGAGASSRRVESGAGSQGRTRARSATHGDQTARAYAALEVPPGSDFETVRKAYRTLMRKYHPDHHTSTPEKQKAANEVAQRLTEAYRHLEKRLRR